MTYRIHSLQEPPQLTQKSRKPLVSDGSKHIMIIHLKYRLIMESVRFRWISYIRHNITTSQQPPQVSLHSTRPQPSGLAPDLLSMLRSHQTWFLAFVCLGARAIRL